MNKMQVIIIAFSVIIVIVALLVFRKEPPSTNIDQQTSELVVWGIDPESVFHDMLRVYESEFRTRVTYIEKDPRTFDRNILEALASKTPPDLIIAEEDWILSNRDKIVPPKPTIVSADLAEQSIVNLASSLFIERVADGTKIQKNIIALPLWLDPLVLYWNKDLFAQVSPDPIAKPPENWDTFLNDSKGLTILGDGGRVVRSGAALGRAKNIPLYKEILSVLLLQLDVDIEGAIYSGGAKEKTASAESVIRFYTDFGNPSTAPKGAYTWNTRMPEPRMLFAEGKLGMMIDLYSFARELRSKNPHLSFDIAPLPQINAARKVNYARVRAITVPRTAKTPDASWLFARWLASGKAIESILKEYDAAPVGRDLLESGKINSLLKTASLTARRPRETYPLENSRILSGLIESVADGQKTVSEAITDARTAYSLFIKLRQGR